MLDGLLQFYSILGRWGGWGVRHSMSQAPIHKNAKSYLYLIISTIVIKNAEHSIPLT